MERLLLREGEEGGVGHEAHLLVGVLGDEDPQGAIDEGGVSEGGFFGDDVTITADGVEVFEGDIAAGDTTEAAGHGTRRWPQHARGHPRGAC